MSFFVVFGIIRCIFKTKSQRPNARPSANKLPCDIFRAFGSFAYNI